MGLIKHQLILFTLFIITISLFAQPKKLKVFRADIVETYALIYKNTDSLKQNKLHAYYAIDSNQLAYEKSYYLGRQSGLYKSYFPQGQLMELVVYQNGRRNGDYTRYDEGGAIVIKAKYRDDKLHGFWINRKKKIQGRYRNGLKQGKWEYNLKTAGYVKRYYNEGELVDQNSFLRGVNIFNKKTEAKTDKTLINSQPKQVNELIVFNDTIVIQDKVYRIKQVPRDSISHPSMYKAVFYDKPDQTAIVKYIYNGSLNGLFQKFYPNGNIYQYSNYSSGQLNGKWKQYSEKGELLIRGNYSKGKKDGTWHYDMGRENYRKEKFKGGRKIK